MAFYCLMEELGIGKGDEVILPAFTCGVIPNAILRRHATPVYTNISEETFGSDPVDIERKITGRTKLVVAQHLFGIPCDIANIAEICKDKGIFLLEDSAPTLDSSFRGKTVGNWGDAAIFSSDHGKPLNTITGGFFYSNNRELSGKIAEKSRKYPDLDPVHQKNLLRRFLFERKYYNPKMYGKGLFLEIFQRKFNNYFAKDRTVVFLDKDYCNPSAGTKQSYPYPAKMLAALAQLGICELERWNTEKVKRKGLLKKYLSLSEELPVKPFLPGSYSDRGLDIVPLRFVFTHPEAERIHKKMNPHVSVMERLYPTVLTCKNMEGLGYTQGSCTISEKISAHIINWPCIVPQEMEKTILNIFTNTFSGDRR